MFICKSLSFPEILLRVFVLFRSVFLRWCTERKIYFRKIFPKRKKRRPLGGRFKNFEFGAKFTEFHNEVIRWCDMVGEDDILVVAAVNDSLMLSHSFICIQCEIFSNCVFISLRIKLSAKIHKTGQMAKRHKKSALKRARRDAIGPGYNLWKWGKVGRWAGGIENRHAVRRGGETRIYPYCLEVIVF